MDESDAPAARTAAEEPAATSGSNSSTSSTGSSGAGTNPFAAAAPTRTAAGRPRAPPPAMAQSADDQREKSMALVNEGLEGLIPRASQLLQLGGSVFLAFLPFMLVASLLFSGIYFAFGDSFLHGGSRPTTPPRYIDPQELLSAPTVDPYIPFDRFPSQYP